MSSINHETQVVIAVKHIFLGIGGIGVVLVGGLWAVLSFTLGGVRDDVSAIRGDMAELHKAAISTPEKMNEVQIAFSKDIDGLRIELEKFRGDFKVVQLAIDDLKAQVVDLRKAPTKKVNWDFTFEDQTKLQDAITKAGFEKGNIIVVPLAAREDNK